MRIAVLDFEALYVPTIGPVPVSEFACTVVEGNQIIASLHLLIDPGFTATEKEDIENAAVVYQSISGLSSSLLQAVGIPIAEARGVIEHFLYTFKDALFLARGPELEQRILNEWGIGRDIKVREITDFVIEPFQWTLYYKRSRPADVRWMAEYHNCGRHDNGTSHCAMADVMEECFWVHFYGDRIKLNTCS